METDQTAVPNTQPTQGVGESSPGQGDNKNVVAGTEIMDAVVSGEGPAKTISCGMEADSGHSSVGMPSNAPAPEEKHCESTEALPQPSETASSCSSQVSERTASADIAGCIRSSALPNVNSDFPEQSLPALSAVATDASIDAETSGMYAEVASTLVKKVNEVNASRLAYSGTSKSLTSTPNTNNESLSLIMSYEISDEDSGEETEKEDGQNNFSAPRYVPVSSGGSSVEEDSSDDEEEDDENTDGGSSVEESEEPEVGDEENNARSTMEEGETDALASARKSKSKKDKDLRDPLMLNLLPPIEKLAITVPEEDCIPVGKIYSIVDRLVVIESLPETPPLDLESVIFNREGNAVGQIFDIFGHVKHPFYSIRFNNPQEIKDLNITVGRVVYCAPKTDHTKYVFTHDLMKEKGSDASWKNDVEPPSSALDYSDDEAEKKAKKGAKVKKEPEVDSPARRRHLSFEQQMNRNNTLRNRAFKRDAQGEARNNWDGGWHNYKKNNAQVFQASTCELPPPPPPRQIQPCVFANPTVNPMNLVIRPPCFNPVIERPPVPLGPSPTTWAPWARFEPPPTPPPRGVSGFVHLPSSPPSSGMQPNFAIGPFQRFQSPPTSGFPGFGPTTYGPPPMAFSPSAPAFSSPPPPSLPMQPSPSRFGPPPSCRSSLPIPPPPFSGSHYSSYHSPKSANSNHQNHPNAIQNIPSNHPNASHHHHQNQPRIPRLPFTSNNNHPPLYNHPPF